MSVSMRKLALATAHSANLTAVTMGSVNIAGYAVSVGWTLNATMLAAAGLPALLIAGVAVAYCSQKITYPSGAR